MTKSKIKLPGWVVITAIICIAGLEAYALFRGLDGVLLTTTIAIIAGLAGWIAPPPKTK